MGEEHTSTDKRDLILDAAARVMAERGYTGLKMEDVAAGAGVGKGTLYLYFSSKEQLLESVVRDAIDRYSDRMVEIAGSDRPGRDTLADLVRYTIEYASGNRAMTRVAFEGMSGLRPEFRDWLLSRREQTLEIIAGMIARACERNDMRRLDPGLAAEVVVGTMNAMAAASMIGGLSADREATVEQVTDMLWRGLGL